jgi:hypothetical protein
MVAKGIKILSRQLSAYPLDTIRLDASMPFDHGSRRYGPQWWPSTGKRVTMHPRHGQSEWKGFYDPMLPRPPGKRKAPFVTPRWLCDNKCLVILKNLKL